jgi:NADH dehydrogenase [ubiquinone] 1 alpha subcomplex assembly factor 7
MRRADPLGAAGDFTTAPEISQMFGEMIGVWIADLWSRAGSPAFRYVELGPGRGTLAADALRTMARFGCTPQGVHLVETSPMLRAAQSARLPAAIHHDDIDDLPDDGAAIIVANEFFDALPVHQYIRTIDGWRERMVVHNGERFLPVAGTRPMDSAVPADLADSPLGTILESSPAAAGMAYEIAARLKAQGGAALFIDYGYAAPQTGSTLQAVRAHRKVDPFADPGLADLTALVDFAQLKRIAFAGDVDCHGPVGQGDWLMALGIAQRAAVLAKGEPGRAQDIMTAFDRLVSPDQMGALFKVMAYRGPGWPVGAGFGG